MVTSSFEKQLKDYVQQKLADQITLKDCLHEQIKINLIQPCKFKKQ